MKTTRETRDLEEAKARAKRAKEYAEKFPKFVCVSDPYGTVEWQLEQLQGFKEKSAPQK